MVEFVSHPILLRNSTINSPFSICLFTETTSSWLWWRRNKCHRTNKIMWLFSSNIGYWQILLSVIAMMLMFHRSHREPSISKLDSQNIFHAIFRQKHTHYPCSSFPFMLQIGGVITCSQHHNTILLIISIQYWVQGGSSCINTTFISYSHLRIVALDITIEPWRIQH